MVFATFFILFSKYYCDPLEGYPHYTPELLLLNASIRADTLLVEISGLHYQKEDGAYILMYLDTDLDTLTGTRFSMGENERYLSLGADYLLLNTPDTITYVYWIPSQYDYNLLGSIESSYEVYDGERFRVRLKWRLPSHVPYLPILLLGGSEEFTDDRFPNEGTLRIFDRSPDEDHR